MLKGSQKEELRKIGNEKSVMSRLSSHKRHVGKHILSITIAVILSGCGAALMIKAQLGINAYDALTVSFSELYDLHIGTVSMIMNFMFFLFQLLLLRNKTEWERFLQIPLLLVLGTAINFMTYDILAGIIISSYVEKLTLFFTGLLLCGISCAVLMKYNIGFPLESFCLVISQKYDLQFSRLRQILDILCIMLVPIFFILYSTTMEIREGTLISMILFGPVIETVLRHIAASY